MTFTLILAQRPPSSNKGRNAKFQNTVGAEATARMAGGTRLDGALYARINWFHRVPTTQDADNIAKNVLDGLKGVVFDDDHRIVKLATHRIDLGGIYAISDQDLGDAVYKELTGLLSDKGHDHVLYIEIGRVVSPKVWFGPVDESGQ